MTDACKETKDINEKSEKSTPRETVRANWYWPLKLFFSNFIFNWKNNIYELKSLCFMIVQM